MVHERMGNVGCRHQCLRPSIVEHHHHDMGSQPSVTQIMKNQGVTVQIYGVFKNISMAILKSADSQFYCRILLTKVSISEYNSQYAVICISPMIYIYGIFE